MSALTPSGEVAVFTDDNQFGSGQSQDKCGPEAVSVVFHSVAPGQHNPYTAGDVHLMAHDDYVAFIGPDVASDGNGTSNNTLYAMLAEHKLTYLAGPADISWTKAQLARGWIVIIGIVESSVEDTQLGTNPYNWTTAGLNHVIVASGAGQANELLCRDTANIDTNGLVRPGPRHYDVSKLRLISATAVQPSWIANPPEPTAPAAQQLQAAAFWSSTAALFGGQAPSYSTGIARSWLSEYEAGRNWGLPITGEISKDLDGNPLTDWNGVPIVAMGFTGGHAEDTKGVIKWYGHP